MFAKLGEIFRRSTTLNTSGELDPSIYEESEDGETKVTVEERGRMRSKTTSSIGNTENTVVSGFELLPTDNVSSPTVEEKRKSFAGRVKDWIQKAGEEESNNQTEGGVKKSATSTGKGGSPNSSPTTSHEEPSLRTNENQTSNSARTSRVVLKGAIIEDYIPHLGESKPIQKEDIIKFQENFAKKEKDLQVNNTKEFFFEVFQLFDEELYGSYLCSLWYNEGVKIGEIHITSNFICFNTKPQPMQSRIAIPLSEINQYKAIFPGMSHDHETFLPYDPITPIPKPPFQYIELKDKFRYFFLFGFVDIEQYSAAAETIFQLRNHDRSISPQPLHSSKSSPAFHSSPAVMTPLSQANSSFMTNNNSNTRKTSVPKISSPKPLHSTQSGSSTSSSSSSSSSGLFTPQRQSTLQRRTIIIGNYSPDQRGDNSPTRSVSSTSSTSTLDNESLTLQSQSPQVNDDAAVITSAENITITITDSSSNISTTLDTENMCIETKDDIITDSTTACGNNDDDKNVDDHHVDSDSVDEASKTQPETMIEQIEVRDRFEYINPQFPHQFLSENDLKTFKSKENSSPNNNNSNNNSSSNNNTATSSPPNSSSPSSSPSSLSRMARNFEPTKRIVNSNCGFIRNFQSEVTEGDLCIFHTFLTFETTTKSYLTLEKRKLSASGFAPSKSNDIYIVIPFRDIISIKMIDKGTIIKITSRNTNHFLFLPSHHFVRNTFNLITEKWKSVLRSSFHDYDAYWGLKYAALTHIHNKSLPNLDVSHSHISSSPHSSSSSSSSTSTPQNSRSKSIHSPNFEVVLIANNNNNHSSPILSSNINSPHHPSTHNSPHSTSTTAGGGATGVTTYLQHEKDIIQRQEYFLSKITSYHTTPHNDLTQRKWKKYIDRNGTLGINVVLTSQLFKLILKYGIPHKYRSIIWQISCGSALRLEIYPGEIDRLLLKNKGKFSQALIDIEKDLHRSLPDHPLYHRIDGSGIGSLRRVLTAYSWRNPEIGYCQSMNILCSVLLLFMSEEEAFWLLSTICENLSVGYYHSPLTNLMVDQHILEVLANEKIPEVITHLENTAIALPIITMPWFLCLFINFLPWDLTLRILDIYFINGASILFQVSLALLENQKEKLLSFEDGVELFNYIKKFETPNPNLFLNNVMKNYGYITNELIEGYRKKYAETVVNEIDEYQEFIATSASTVETEIEVPLLPSFIQKSPQISRGSTPPSSPHRRFAYHRSINISKSIYHSDPTSDNNNTESEKMMSSLIDNLGILEDAIACDEDEIDDLDENAELKNIKNLNLFKRTRSNEIHRHPLFNSRKTASNPHILIPGVNPANDNEDSNNIDDSEIEQV